jgi:pyochelin biosynthetic protein PchC
MGASVAHETALRLRADSGRDLAALFVSGRAGPGRQRDQRLADVSDAQLVRDVARLGGMDASAFTDPELLDLVLPAIRADYGLLGRYRASAGDGGFSCPVVACYGDDDPDVDEVSASAWSDVTWADYEQRVYPGGHFYLTDHAPTVLEDVFSRLRRMAASRS